MEGAFDNAPLGVDINVYTRREEAGRLSWTAVAYPLVEMRNEALSPDYGVSLLGFNFQFTNDEKNELEAQAFYTGNSEGNSETWYERTMLDTTPK